MTGESASVLTALVKAAGEVGRHIEGDRYCLGIDLGTTNSTAVVIDAQLVLEGDVAAAIREVSVRQEGRDRSQFDWLVPSVVAQPYPEGPWWVGRGAKELRSSGQQRGRTLFFSTKSEMGLGREPFYHSSVETSLDTPYKVAGRILKALAQATEEEFGPQPLDRAVVTVPASFQLAARKDTFRAAELAGIHLGERALLDEPNAAFLDYLLTVHGSGGAKLDLTSPRNVLVFDFGGGTCDVSIIGVRADARDGRVALRNLSIARFEQLGGDNIDAAIVEQVLFPALQQENGLDRLDFSWSEKKNRLLPQLLGTAEALKLAICSEYARLRGLRRDRPIDKKTVYASQPGLQVELPARADAALRTVILERPSLTLEQFEKLLEPFVDPDLPYPKDTEINAVNSIFAPVNDALERAGLKPEDVDGVLLAGGSSLIPQVQDALAEFFPKATLLRFPDEQRTLTAVARGAALHSFFLHLLGRPLLKAITQESIGVLAQGAEFVELLPRGTELPYPASGEFASFTGLQVPRDLMRDVQIVLAAESADKILGVEHLRVGEIKCAGEPIELRWRLDANKVLEVEARLVNMPDARCEVRLENPLCAVAYRDERHRRIVELEQRISEGIARRVPRSELAEPMQEIGWALYADGRYERALDFARSAMQAEGRADIGMLNLRALAYDQLGAPERAEKAHREAIAVAPGNSTAYFNLSLLLDRQGRDEEALKLAQRAVELDPRDGAYHAQLGALLEGAGRAADARQEFETAARLLDKEPSLSSFLRHWRIMVAERLGDQATARRLRASATSGAAQAVGFDEDKLPAQAAGALVRRES